MTKNIKTFSTKPGFLLKIGVYFLFCGVRQVLLLFLATSKNSQFWFGIQAILLINLVYHYVYNSLFWLQHP